MKKTTHVKDRRLSKWTHGTVAASSAALLASCSPAGLEGSCVQTASSSVVREQAIGGMLVTGGNSQCAMQLRLLEETPQGFRARLESASHCAEFVGQIPDAATLRIFVNDGYAESVPFVGQYSQALATFREIAKRSGPEASAFVDWGIMPTKTAGSAARRAQQSTQTSSSGSSSYEQDLLSYVSGCPVDMPGGKSLCFSAGDLFLDHILIARESLDQRSIGNNMTLGSLFRDRLEGHKRLSAAEGRLSGASGMAGGAGKMLAAAQRAAHLGRLAAVAPLTEVAATCQEIAAQSKEEFLGQVSEGTTGSSNGLMANYGIKLLSNRARAESIWNFCKGVGGTSVANLQKSFDAVPISLDRSLGDLRTGFGRPGLSEDTWSTLLEETGNQIRSAWQGIEKPLVSGSEFGRLSYATNAPAVLDSGTSGSQAQASRTDDALQFQYLPLTSLLKGESERAAYRADQRNFGPVFVANDASDFLVDWRKGASGTIISYHSEGISVPLAALTAVNDEYSSGGVAALPLPTRSNGTNARPENSPDTPSDALAGEPNASNKTFRTSAELDPRAAHREGVIEVGQDGRCF